MNTSDIDQSQPKRMKASDEAPTGDVAGTVLRAARLSAGLSRAQFARKAGADESTVASWEDGIVPLATVPAPQLDQLKTTLASAGAKTRLIADLDPAMWADVVLATLANSEDVTCLLADPLASDPGFTDLLGWACNGKTPPRYRRFTPAAPFVHPRPAAGLALP